MIARAIAGGEVGSPSKTDSMTVNSFYRQKGIAKLAKILKIQNFYGSTNFKSRPPQTYKSWKLAENDFLVHF